MGPIMRSLYNSNLNCSNHLATGVALTAALGATTGAADSTTVAAVAGAAEATGSAETATSAVAAAEAAGAGASVDAHATRQTDAIKNTNFDILIISCKRSCVQLYYNFDDNYITIKQTVQYFYL
jgi:hypothetical protein